MHYMNGLKSHKMFTIQYRTIILSSCMEALMISGKNVFQVPSTVYPMWLTYNIFQVLFAYHLSIQVNKNTS